MFSYALVIMTLHIMYFDFGHRAIAMCCIVFSLSTAGWGGWSGERGWSTLGQPLDSAIVLTAVLVGSMLGYMIERMMRTAFLLQQAGRGELYPHRMQGAISAFEAAVSNDIAAHAFETLGILGHGSSGDVFLVRKTPPASSAAHTARASAAAERDKAAPLFALKRVSKVGLGAVKADFLNEECRILQTVMSPFVVRLEDAFQTDSCVYLAMSYAGGGNLAEWMNRFTAESARLVSAEVFLALRYLHSICIIYRDLKLENTLVGLDGHIMLSDFGVSKRLRMTVQGGDDRKDTRTLVGTPIYMPPEQFNRDGYSYYVDFWAAAVMLHEMLTGSDTGPCLDPKVLEEGFMDATAAHLLRRMLVPDRSRRLGCAEGDLERIMSDAYFEGHGSKAAIDWDRLERKEIAGPLVANEALESSAINARTIKRGHPATFSKAFQAEKAGAQQVGATHHPAGLGKAMCMTNTRDAVSTDSVESQPNIAAKQHDAVADIGRGPQERGAVARLKMD